MTSNNLTAVVELAGQAYDQFETRQRPDGEDYTALKDTAPEWLRDLVREAHHDMLPDDWRYESIHSAIGAIHDNGPDDIDDYGHEWADSNVDTYNTERTHWLASNLNRGGYCDEAISEGLFVADEDHGVFDLIGAGQYMESREIFESVRRSLEDRADELDS